MNRLLLKKYIHESALLFFACGFMVMTFCWARVWILCQFDLQQFEPLLNQFRQFEKYSPVPLEQFLTYSGGIGMTFQEPVLILCVLVWAISRGSDVVSGEIGRGTLEMLLAQPIGRVQLMVCHAVVCILGLAILCALAWLGIYCGIQTNSVKEAVAPTIEIKLPLLPIQVPVQVGPTQVIQTPLAERVRAVDYIAPAFNLFAFGFFVMGLSVLCSSFDRYRWRTLGIVISIYVVQLLMFLLSKATESTKFFSYFTFFTAYQPDSIVHFGRDSTSDAWWLFVPDDRLSRIWSSGVGPLGLTAILMAFGIAFFIIAIQRFKTRDIPAPL